MAGAIGPCLDALAHTIESRREAGDTSYTYRLLSGTKDEAIKKVVEEAAEVALAAKDLDALLAQLENQPSEPESDQTLASLESKIDSATNHLRYEIGDVIYHTLVVLTKYGISLDDLAAELNSRMTTHERPKGAKVLSPSSIQRA